MAIVILNFRFTHDMQLVRQMRVMWQAFLYNSKNIGQFTAYHFHIPKLEFFKINKYKLDKNREMPSDILFVPIFKKVNVI